MATVQALVSSPLRLMVDLSGRIKVHDMATVQDLVSSPISFMIDLSDRIKEHGYSASLGVKPFEINGRPI